MSQIELKNLTKKHGQNTILENLNLTIKSGEFLVFVGPSGCGKSTTLRLIAGLDEVSGGEISIGGKVVNDVAPRDRNIAMVFQNYALYPHMTVFENMAFSLRMRKATEDEIQKKVHEASKLLGLDEMLERKTNQLSGGQRQRVAMGRAIVRNPAVFLFDEPLSNLDAKLRNQMRAEIKKLHERLKTTTVYVTHDQVEAMTLADRIVLLRKGFIEQIGKPEELYEKPANVFVASFLGNPSMNFLKATIVDGKIKCGNSTLAETASFKFLKDYAKKEITVGIRPEKLLHQEASFQVSGTIDLVEILGSSTLVHLQLDDGQKIIGISKQHNLKTQTKGTLSFNPQDLHFFDIQSEKRLGD